MQNEKLTILSVRRFCSLACLLMLCIYGALVLSTSTCEDMYKNNIILDSNLNKIEMVSFKCPVLLGTDVITDLHKCTIEHKRSKLSEISTKISNLENSKKKTLNCGIVLLSLTALCTLIQGVTVFAKKKHTNI